MSFGKKFFGVFLDSDEFTFLRAARILLASIIFQRKITPSAERFWILAHKTETMSTISQITKKSTICILL